MGGTHLRLSVRIRYKALPWAPRACTRGNLAKNWLQYVRNRVARPTNVTNLNLVLFYLAIVVTPIDRFCSCA